MSTGAASVSDLMALDIHSPRGRPKDASKRAGIVEAAGALFMEQGFLATSMDAIAARAGVSKVTLYSHFADKQALFRAAILARCDQLLDPSAMVAVSELEPEQALHRIACDFLDLVASAPAQAMHRLVVHEGARHPDIAQEFFQSAIMHTCDKISGVFARLDRMGKLKVPSPDLTAGAFLGAVKGMVALRAELHQPPWSEAEVDAHCRHVARLFAEALRA